MTVTTCTLQEVLMELARELHEVKNEFVTNVSGATVTLGNCNGADNFSDYGLTEITGKGIRGVGTSGASSYVSSTKVLTLASAFSPVAAKNDVIQIAWYKADLRAQALAAIHEAITEAYRFGWWREVVLDRNHLTLADGTTTTTLTTLDADTDTVAMPADLRELFAIGIQDETTERVLWTYRVEPNPVWDVYGNAGAWYLKFNEYPNGGSFNEVYDGESLCLRYASEETIPALETTSAIQIPKWALVKAAAEIYQRRTLRQSNDTRRAQMQLALPQAQDQLAKAFATIRKQRPTGYD